MLLALRASVASLRVVKLIPPNPCLSAPMIANGVKIIARQDAATSIVCPMALGVTTALHEHALP